MNMRYFLIQRCRAGIFAPGKGEGPLRAARRLCYHRRKGRGLPVRCAGGAIVRVPLMRAEAPILRSYCAFWKKDNSGYFVEAFAKLLQAQFEKKTSAPQRAECAAGRTACR